jgi:hypothetical protein
MNDYDPDLLLVGKHKKVGINVAIDPRVLEAFNEWIRKTGASKGATASLAIQRFLESKGVQIPGVTQPTTIGDPPQG